MLILHRWILSSLAFSFTLLSSPCPALPSLILSILLPLPSHFQFSSSPLLSGPLLTLSLAFHHFSLLSWPVFFSPPSYLPAVHTCSETSGDPLRATCILLLFNILSGFQYTIVHKCLTRQCLQACIHLTHTFTQNHLQMRYITSKHVIKVNTLKEKCCHAALLFKPPPETDRPEDVWGQSQAEVCERNEPYF